jgi:hypothetical protein
MQIQFTLKDRLAGFSLSTAEAGEEIQVSTRELIGPMDSMHLVMRLDQLHRMVFSKIPKLPPPTKIDDLTVIINNDLSAIAYYNEINTKAQIRTTRDVEAGSPVLLSDIADIESVDPGIDIPDDSAVIIIRSFNWKRSLHFEFSPIRAGATQSEVPISRILAKQMLLLLGLLSTPPLGDTIGSKDNRFNFMSQGLDKLKYLLKHECDKESEYQELLEMHPWMFGGQYTAVERHTNFDDTRIPDFTAVRCYDNYRDIIELKQPFLRCFKKDNKFGSGFNDSWNQAEDYLNFTLKNRSYLRDEKDLLFENPRCKLLLGYNLSKPQLKRISDKQRNLQALELFTYNNLLSTAEHILTLVHSAGDSPLEDIDG